MKRAALALGLLCGACGGSGSSTPSTLVTATEAATFTGLDAYSVQDQVQLGTVAQFWTSNRITVRISATPGSCASIEAKTLRANTTFITIEIINGATDPITAGTYNVENLALYAKPTPSATAAVTSLDASCDVLNASGAVAGTVTLTQVGTSGVSGSIDVTLSDGAKVSGSFVAPACDVSVEPQYTCVQ